MHTARTSCTFTDQIFIKGSGLFEPEPDWDRQGETEALLSSTCSFCRRRPPLATLWPLIILPEPGNSPYFQNSVMDFNLWLPAKLKKKHVTMRRRRERFIEYLHVWFQLMCEHWKQFNCGLKWKWHWQQLKSLNVHSRHTDWHKTSTALTSAASPLTL